MQLQLTASGSVCYARTAEEVVEPVSEHWAMTVVQALFKADSGDPPHIEHWADSVCHGALRFMVVPTEVARVIGASTSGHFQCHRPYLPSSGGRPLVTLLHEAG